MTRNDKGGRHRERKPAPFVLQAERRSVRQDEIHNSVSIEQILDLQLANDAGELHADAESVVLNNAIFGAIYYRLLLRSGPLTKKFAEELIEQVIRGHRKPG